MSRRKKQRRTLRVLVIMHPDYMPPTQVESATAREAYDFKTEWDVLHGLRELGHEVQALGVQDELLPIRQAVEAFDPHLVWNLLEEFHGDPSFDHHVVSYLALLRVPYTGSAARGMMLARDKALSKKLLAYHRIPAPAFAVFPRGQRVRMPRHLTFPLIVKSLTEESSLGISQASVVEDAEKLGERVRFIHESIGSDAIAERFIEGRELYVGVIGNRRLEVLPVWELTFDNLPRGALAIATARVKHNPEYQEKRGVKTEEAKLPAELAERIRRTSRRIYRILELDGYARIDYRLAEDGTLYFLEANPNPDIAEREDFAAAARAAGIAYPELLERVLNLGLGRAR